MLPAYISQVREKFVEKKAACRLLGRPTLAGFMKKWDLLEKWGDETVRHRFHPAPYLGLDISLRLFHQQPMWFGINVTGLVFSFYP